MRHFEHALARDASLGRECLRTLGERSDRADDGPNVTGVDHVRQLGERRPVGLDDEERGTVTRLGDERFRLVSGTAFGNHDLGWIRKQLATWDGERADLRDVTGSLCCLGLWGPLARDVLQPVTPLDLSNDGFPYLTARESVVGDVPCLIPTMKREKATM